MQHGMHNSMEMVKIHYGLIDQQLKYHYLVADQTARKKHLGDGAGVIATVRSFFASRPALTQERGV